jgi:hypothetical protein
LPIFFAIPKRVIPPRSFGHFCAISLLTKVSQKAAHSPSRATMSTQSGMWVPDTNRPIFDPNLDIATVVFSHVQCVRTRFNLAQVSKLWRDASKEVGYDTLCAKDRSLLSLCETQAQATVDIMKMLKDPARQLSNVWAMKVELERKSQGDTLVKVLARHFLLQSVAEIELYAKTVAAKAAEAAAKAEKRMTKEKQRRAEFFEANGCEPCHYAAYYKLWDCLQKAVDNKCPGWEYYAEKYAEHLR